LLPIFGRYNNHIETIGKYMAGSSQPTNPRRASKRMFAHVLATCHSLALHDDQILGSREDSEMLASTRATILPPAADDPTLEGGSTIKLGEGGVTAKQLRKHFSQEQKLLSTIVRNSDQPNDLWLYARVGLCSLGQVCRAESMPNYWRELANSYEQDGHLTYGICAKRVESAEALNQGWDRILMNMDLLGLVVLRLTVKNSALETVNKWKHGKLACKMLSGESPNVALAISRMVGLVGDAETIVFGQPQGADGHNPEAIQWVKVESAREPESNTPGLVHDIAAQDPSTHYKVVPPEEVFGQNAANVAVVCDQGAAKHCLVQRSTPQSSGTLKRGRIYSNMYGNNLSVDLVSRLSRDGESVLMVGSPCSEYGALSKSDVGVLLTTSSRLCVFSAFTCTNNDVASVPLIIAEGRAALVTSYECFKWMAMSSIIQFTTTTILYYYNMSLSDEQYLYVDLFLVIPLAFTMSWSRPSSELSPEQPQSSLLSLPVLASVTGQMIIQITMQAPVRFSCTRSSSFCFSPPKPEPAPPSQ
jgi:cation-transporting ATPase 13A2